MWAISFVGGRHIENTDFFVGVFLGITLFALFG
jgi:hypothetical protein